MCRIHLVKFFTTSSSQGEISAASKAFQKFQKNLLTKILTNFQYLKSFIQSGLDPHLSLQYYSFQALQLSLLELIAIYLAIYLCA